MNRTFPDNYSQKSIEYNTLMLPVWERRQVLLKEGNWRQMDEIIARDFPHLKQDLARIEKLPNLRVVPQTSVIVRDVLDVNAAYNTLMRPVWERRQELLKEGNWRQMDAIIAHEFSHIKGELKKLREAA